MTLAEKHRKAIDEAAARLVSRAANPRGLGVDEIAPRVVPAVEKYLFATGKTRRPARSEILSTRYMPTTCV